MGKRVMLLLAATMMLAAACGNVDENGQESSGGGGAPNTTASAEDLQKKVPSDQPGVTDTEIRVGGVASVTNPLGGNYDRAFDGVKAYFEMVNESGGIYGRKLVLAEERDDQVAKNQEEVQALLASNVFAVLPVATLLFTGADALAAEGVPTFGWNINAEYAGPPNLFGDRGSYICFTCPDPFLAWLAQHENRTKVAVLAYNVDQSAECAKRIPATFEKWPVAEVVFEDSSLSYGTTDFSVQVGKMKDAGVDFVATCMDTNGVVNLQRELDKQDVDVTQQLPQAYNPEVLASFGELFEGSYVQPWTMPYESADKIPALETYLQWLDRVGGVRDEITAAGWLNADLLYKGLVAAGPEFTQQSVVDAINQMKWDADGLIPGVDWSIAHESLGNISCISLVKIENGQFVPQLQQPGKPYLCLDRTSDTLPEQPENRAGQFR
jgi:ABC-type branched-subunit amino acid transport system substrate-binding protein